MSNGPANWYATPRRVRVIGSVIFLILIVTCPTTARAQTPEMVQKLEQVAALIRDNRINEAETKLRSILRTTRNAPVALNLMGTIRAKQGRLNEAETLFLSAVRGDKKFVGARMNLAYLYLLKRQPQKTIAELNEVLRLEPTNQGATQQLAELLLSQARVDECIALIEKLRSQQAVSAPLLVVLGDAYLAKNDLKKAEEVYLQSLEGRLDNAGALLGLAQIAFANNESREAIIYLRRVSTLAADSTSPHFLYRFALLSLKGGMADEAKTAVQKALSLKPNEPTYLLVLGVVWLKKTDLFEAEKVFRKLLELQPNNSQGQLHLGYVLLNQKKYVEAREWLEKSARSDNPIPEVFYYLGLVAQEQNDDAGAVALFEKAIQKLPSYVHVRVAIGSSYMKLRNYERAQQELETAVKLDPEDPKAHYNLALLYARLKDPVRAQEQMRIVDQLKSKGVTTDSDVVVLPPSPPQ